jgi:thiamine-phosphate diphosphorylase/hydroxyethylthiazole kinase
MKIDRSKVDYTLYLVTNNEMVPEGLTIYEQVEKALQNGVTLVQLREKNLEINEFIERANKIHKITEKYNVPLIINDNVDVALAIDAEGLHIGQDDINPIIARKLIGNDKILGLTAKTVEHLDNLFNLPIQIDYIGMGTIYETTTKKVAIPPFGIIGAQNLLKYIYHNKTYDLKVVLIGGLNKHNITEVLSNCSYNGYNANGVAVVSCIMAQKDAALETKETLRSVKDGFYLDK